MDTFITDPKFSCVQVLWYMGRSFGKRRRSPRTNTNQILATRFERPLPSGPERPPDAVGTMETGTGRLSRAL